MTVSSKIPRYLRRAVRAAAVAIMASLYLKAPSFGHDIGASPGFLRCAP